VRQLELKDRNAGIRKLEDFRKELTRILARPAGITETGIAVQGATAFIQVEPCGELRALAGVNAKPGPILGRISQFDGRFW